MMLIATDLNYVSTENLLLSGGKKEVWLFEDFYVMHTIRSKRAASIHIHKEIETKSVREVRM